MNLQFIRIICLFTYIIFFVNVTRAEDSSKLESNIGMKIISSDSKFKDSIKFVDFVFGKAEYDSGFNQGIREAEKEIAEDNITLYLGEYNATIDKETGLLVRISHLSCRVNFRRLGCYAGHDSTIIAYIEKNGLPENTRKPWIDLIENSKETYDSIANIQEPCCLSPREIICIDPTIKYAIRASNESYIGVDVTYNWVYVGDVDNTFENRTLLCLPGESLDSVLVVWGPENADIAFLKIFFQKNTLGVFAIRESPIYETLDFRWGKYLDFGDPPQPYILLDGVDLKEVEK